MSVKPKPKHKRVLNWIAIVTVLISAIVGLFVSIAGIIDPDLRLPGVLQLSLAIQGVLGFVVWCSIFRYAWLSLARKLRRTDWSSLDCKRNPASCPPQPQPPDPPPHPPII